MCVGVHTKGSPRSSSGSESDHESPSDGLSSVAVAVTNSSEKEVSAELSKEGLSSENTTANKVATKIGFDATPIKGKVTRASSSSSDCSFESVTNV